VPRRKLNLSPRRRSKRSSYGACVLDDSPAAFWRLNDKTGRLAEDTSGQDNTGLYLGTPGLGAPPLIADSDASVHFDGRDDEINFPDAASLSSTKALSVEAWMSADDVPTSAGSVWQLISKWDTALLYLQGGKSPKLVFALYDTTSSSFGSVVVSTTTVAANTAYHVVGTYDGSKLRIYVNGSLEAESARRGFLNDSPLGGAIAAEGWGKLPSPRFQGRLGEIAIYKTALTQAKVRAHYRAGTSG
jgi:large repetitive protein